MFSFTCTNIAIWKTVLTPSKFTDPEILSPVSWVQIKKHILTDTKSAIWPNWIKYNKYLFYPKSTILNEVVLGMRKSFVQIEAKTKTQMNIKTKVTSHLVQPNLDQNWLWWPLQTFFGFGIFFPHHNILIAYLHYQDRRYSSLDFS